MHHSEQAEGSARALFCRPMSGIHLPLSPFIRLLEESMDRIDAMKVFVAALDEGSLAGAGRKLGRSPAAVSRALAFLEGHVGVQLLHRTTRSSKLSEAGE